jgi:fructose-1,6-bisphosphatase/inositol monophosphatase family enzyme
MTTVHVSDDDIQEFFDVALRLTKEAGAIVVHAISREKEISTKASDTDVVTLTDKAVEKMLFDGLR